MEFTTVCMLFSDLYFSPYLPLLLLCYVAVRFLDKSRHPHNNIQSLGGWWREFRTGFRLCRRRMPFSFADIFFLCFSHGQNCVVWQFLMRFNVLWSLIRWQDIQIRGVNRDEKNIEMAQKYPNCRHFLTYRHSLRVCIWHDLYEILY